MPELEARVRLHDTILCRNRLRRLAGLYRDEARRRTKASAARLCTAEIALPPGPVPAGGHRQPGDPYIEAPDRDGLLEMLLPDDALIRR